MYVVTKTSISTSNRELFTVRERLGEMCCCVGEKVNQYDRTGITSVHDIIVIEIQSAYTYIIYIRYRLKEQVVDAEGHKHKAI